MGNDVTKKNSYELELSKTNGHTTKSSSPKDGNKLKSRIKTKRSKCWKCGFSLLIFNLLLNLVIAIGLWCTNIYYDSIYKIVNLDREGLLFDLWRDPSVARMIKVYPFNYTNMDIVKKGDAVPHVQEIGPFVFKERVQKVNVQFNTSTGTLTYQDNRTHEFVPELSKGSLNDDIILPHFPVLAALHIEDSNMLEYSGIAFIKLATFPQDTLKLKVEDIIWGFDDRFTKVSRAISSLLKPASTAQNSRKFGILSMRSGLSADRVTVGTGKPNLDNFGVISGYNGKSKIGAWKDDNCDRIEGSEGGLYPRKLVKPNSTLSVYTKELCRRLPLVYEKNVITKEGIPALRFRMPGNVFDSPDKNPDNKCYCRNSGCPPSGTFNTAPCNLRLPVLISYPHFTHADPVLRTKVTGLTPDADRYQTLVDVHEYGVTVRGVSRLQINFFLKKSKNTPWLNLKDETVLPLGWIEISMGELSDFLKLLLDVVSFTIPKVEIAARYTSLTFVLISIPLIYVMLKCGKYKQVNLQ